MNDSKLPPTQPIPAEQPLQDPCPADCQPSRPSVSPEEREKIIKLYKHGYGMRKIAARVLRDRKTVRSVLMKEQLLKPARASAPCKKGQPRSKLDPFREEIQEKLLKHLTVTRIFREIREIGYTGGRTILSDHVRSIQGAIGPRKPVKRRFETKPAEEMQVDWTVFTVPVASEPLRVHALACVLAYSRMLHIHFYRDEKQSTLLEGLARAFEAFSGVCLRVVFDNMATVVLGRIGRDRKPIWHPRFLDFARYYGFEPFACRVRDPDRKGKDERILDYLEKDFVRGSEFSSFEELNERAKLWTDQVANKRVHGTTQLIPEEAWLVEKDLLIRLPENRFPVYEEASRGVGPDSTISIGGTPYTVPAELADLPMVPVRLYAEHFEVLNRRGEVAFSRRYVEPRDKGRLQIVPAHYAGLPVRSPGIPHGRLEEEFLKRFPSLGSLVEGIKLRMKALSSIHLRALLRLASRYGEAPFLKAATLAQDNRRFNAEAVRRILERNHPIAPNESIIVPLGVSARTLTLLTEVDPASLDLYSTLDTVPPAPAEQTNGSLEETTAHNENSDDEPKEDSHDS
jgi:transposase